MNKLVKWKNIWKKDIQRNWSIYLMVLPVVIFFLLFSYKPMYGALIAFQNYKPAKGFGVEWVGVQHFIDFMQNPFFGRLIRNTAVLGVLQIVVGFPIPIIFALMVNEIHSQKYKNVMLSFTYLPHFISLVVICGMIKQFCLSDGLFNDIIVFFGGQASPLLQRPGLYRMIYTITCVWQNFGWDSIIFIAAVSGVDKQLYEAASIDGAGKWKQMIHVTIPGIMPTIVIMLILKVGNLMSIGYEKTILLYNEATYETADIISSYVYRYGMENRQYSYSTAVGLFNSAINVILVIVANKISRRISETSLW